MTNTPKPIKRPGPNWLARLKERREQGYLWPPVPAGPIYLEPRPQKEKDEDSKDE